MPLSHQVGGVAGLAEPLGQRVHVWRQTAGLAGPDDGVLEPRVDLIPAEEEEEERGGGGAPDRVEAEVGYLPVISWLRDGVQMGWT